MYEGRTRGKRLRYTFDEEDDFYSDGLPSRRSGRHSGRESPVAHSGPTVTASGRQVKSRTTGLYGEPLLSGQSADRASPATGDYMRSDVSEEPRQGRSTRAANRATTNGRGLKRTIDSEDEDDATSWDGGDEDEDEPEHMDLDDEDEEVADDEDDEEGEGSQSLIVTLRYHKGASESSTAPAVNGVSADTSLHGMEGQTANSSDTLLTDTKPIQQLELPQKEAQLQQGAEMIAPLGASPLSAVPGKPSNDAILSELQNSVESSNENLPHSDGPFAPTPPYGASEEIPKPQPPAQPSSLPAQGILQAHTPASSL